MSDTTTVVATDLELIAARDGFFAACEGVAKMFPEAELEPWQEGWSIFNRRILFPGGVRIDLSARTAGMYGHYRPHTEVDAFVFHPKHTARKHRTLFSTRNMGNGRLHGRLLTLLRRVEAEVQRAEEAAAARKSRFEQNCRDQAVLVRELERRGITGLVDDAMRYVRTPGVYAFVEGGVYKMNIHLPLPVGDVDTIERVYRLVREIETKEVSGG